MHKLVIKSRFRFFRFWEKFRFSISNTGIVHHYFHKKSRTAIRTQINVSKNIIYPMVYCWFPINCKMS